MIEKGHQATNQNCLWGISKGWLSPTWFSCRGTVEISAPFHRQWRGKIAPPTLLCGLPPMTASTQCVLRTKIIFPENKVQIFVHTVPIFALLVLELSLDEFPFWLSLPSWMAPKKKKNQKLRGATSTNRPLFRPAGLLEQSATPPLFLGSPVASSLGWSCCMPAPGDSFRGGTAR